MRFKVPPTEQTDYSIQTCYTLILGYHLLRIKPTTCNGLGNVPLTTLGNVGKYYHDLQPMGSTSSYLERTKSAEVVSCYTHTCM